MVRIHDINVALDFYCNKLGLIERNRSEDAVGKYTNIFLYAPGDEVGAVENSTPLLELTYNWPNESGETEVYASGRNFGHLAYEVDNIYETCQKLMDDGIVINRPPRDGRMAFIKSPDSISIELLQSGSPLEKSEPWTSMENVNTW